MDRTLLLCYYRLEDALLQSLIKRYQKGRILVLSKYNDESCMPLSESSLSSGFKWLSFGQINMVICLGPPDEGHAQSIIGHTCINAPETTVNYILSTDLFPAAFKYKLVNGTAVQQYNQNHYRSCVLHCHIKRDTIAALLADRTSALYLHQTETSASFPAQIPGNSILINVERSDQEEQSRR